MAMDASVGFAGSVVSSTSPESMCVRITGPNGASTTWSGMNAFIGTVRSSDGAEGVEKSHTWMPLAPTR